MRALLMALTLFGPSIAGQSIDVPEDFGLRLEFGVCTTDVADTFQQQYVRDQGSGKHASARLKLSSEQLHELDRLVTDASFFDYPARFRPEGGGLVEPFFKMTLKVRRDGRTHSVSWDDMNESKAPEARRLRTLVMAIVAWFHDLPAVKRLPPAEVLCL